MHIRIMSKHEQWSSVHDKIHIKDAEKPKASRADVASGEFEAEPACRCVAAPCRCVAAPDGFGVSVDLSCFFNDERARCWVWVSARRRVSWLAARLRRRLGLPRRLALLAPAGLLHPADPLALLRPQGTVRVIPLDCELFEDDTLSPCDEKCTIHEAVSEVDRSDSPDEPDGPDGLAGEDEEQQGEEEAEGGERKRCLCTALLAGADWSRPCHRPCCAAGPPDARALLRVKAQALALLDRYEESVESAPRPGRAPCPPAAVRSPDAGDTAAGARRPARRRRRVHRRARAPALQPAATPEPATQVRALSPALLAAAGAAAGAGDVAVVRAAGAAAGADAVAVVRAARAARPACPEPVLRNPGPRALAPRLVRAL